MNCILPLDLEQEKDEDHHGHDVLEDFVVTGLGMKWGAGVLRN
jgi:hypothetical protein